MFLILRRFDDATTIKSRNSRFTTLSDSGLAFPQR